MNYHTGSYAPIDWSKVAVTGIGCSGYYAGPLAVPSQYQSPTKYRVCSYCKTQAEIGKQCQSCGAGDIREKKRLIYD